MVLIPPAGTLIRFSGLGGRFSGLNVARSLTFVFGILLLKLVEALLRRGEAACEKTPRLPPSPLEDVGRKLGCRIAPRGRMTEPTSDRCGGLRMSGVEKR